MPTAEHIVDASVPQVFVEVVDSVSVPMPQFVEEVVQVAPERTAEQIVFEMSVPQEHSFFVPPIKEEVGWSCSDGDVMFSRMRRGHHHLHSSDMTLPWFLQTNIVCSTVAMLCSTPSSSRTFYGPVMFANSMRIFFTNKSLFVLTLDALLLIPCIPKRLDRSVELKSCVCR